MAPEENVCWMVTYIPRSEVRTRSEEVAGSEDIEVVDEVFQMEWLVVILLVVSWLVVPKVAVAEPWPTVRPIVPITLTSRDSISSRW
jgi:hypothetical protein